MIGLIARLFGLQQAVPTEPAVSRKKSSTLLRLQRDWARTTLNFEGRTLLQSEKLCVSRRCGLQSEK